MTKNEILTEVETIVDFILKDCRTFVYAKLKLDIDKKNGRRYSHGYTGGGNFLCASGIFAVLNLLSKINSVLNRSTDFWTEAEINIAIDKFKSLDSDSKQYFQKKPNKKSLKKTETDCFKEFFIDTRDKVDWGINNQEEAEKFWCDYRNALAHIAMPRRPLAAIDTLNDPRFNDKDFDGVIDAINAMNKPIYYFSDRTESKVIWVEKLNESLPVISSFIKNKIEACCDDVILAKVQKILAG